MATQKRKLNYINILVLLNGLASLIAVIVVLYSKATHGL